MKQIFLYGDDFICEGFRSGGDAHMGRVERFLNDKEDEYTFKKVTPSPENSNRSEPFKGI
jgi:hypothetical protein